MALSTVNEVKTALYQVLWEVEQAFGTAFPEGWVYGSKMDPADKVTLLQGYGEWKKTYALNVNPTTNLLNTPAYGSVGAGGWVNGTGASGGAAQEH
jgi:hypothetical protein